MIAQTFTPAYFAQKTLAAALLGTTARKIDSIEIVGAYALVLESGAVYPVAIELTELEAEHDRQRRDRGAALTVETAPDGGWDVTGGDEPHYVHGDGCDCGDWARQFEAGRPAPWCKHLAAVELAGVTLTDAVLAAADAARADLGW